MAKEIRNMLVSVVAICCLNPEKDAVEMQTLLNRTFSANPARRSVFA